MKPDWASKEGIEDIAVAVLSELIAFVLSPLLGMVLGGCCGKVVQLIGPFRGVLLAGLAVAGIRASGEDLVSLCAAAGFFSFLLIQPITSKLADMNG